MLQYSFFVVLLYYYHCVMITFL